MDGLIDAKPWYCLIEATFEDGTYSGKADVPYYFNGFDVYDSLKTMLDALAKPVLDYDTGLEVEPPKNLPAELKEFRMSLGGLPVVFA
jgi:hypothetical protein